MDELKFQIKIIYSARIANIQLNLLDRHSGFKQVQLDKP